MSRRPLLIWLSLWMLAVPLVHVHPDADHRHGTSDHLHGGTVHTIFSKDLACEFSGHDHGLAAFQGSPAPLHLAAPPLHGLEHFEIDVVLGYSTEPQGGKGPPLDVAAHFLQPDESLTPQSERQREPAVSPISHLLATASRPRAPPIA